MHSRAPPVPYGLRPPYFGGTAYTPNVIPSMMPMNTTMMVNTGSYHSGMQPPTLASPVIPLNQPPPPSAPLKSTPATISAPPTASSSNKTVYVGSISPNVSDEFIKQLLEKCGTVIRWNRTTDPISCKPAAFGFCEFDSSEGTYRSFKLLNNMKLADKQLKVNCQDKVKKAITEWRASKLQSLAEASASKTASEAEEQLDEEDEKIRADLEHDVLEFNEQLKSQTAAAESAIGMVEGPTTGSTQGVALSTEAATGTEHSTSSRVNDVSPRHRSSSPSKSSLETLPYVSREYKPHWRERERLSRLKRREREAEKSFLRREKDWEEMEIEIRKEYEKELQKDQRINEETKRKLIELDSKGKSHGRSTSSNRRKHERKAHRVMEKEDDEVDRLEEEREKREERERAEYMASIEESVCTVVEGTEGLMAVESEELIEDGDKILNAVEDAVDVEKGSNGMEDERKECGGAVTSAEIVESDQTVRAPIEIETKAFQPVRFSQQTSAAVVTSAFEFWEEDEESSSRKHKPLTKLEEHRDQRNQTQYAEERVKLIEDSAKVLSLVPSEREEIFAFPLKWETIKKEDVIESKLRPWVRKKAIEYMGAGEDLVQDVIDYVINQVAAEPDPYELLRDLERFLDEEAEIFMKSMWRMLIYVQLKLESQ